MKSIRSGISLLFTFWLWGPGFAVGQDAQAAGTDLEKRVAALERELAEAKAKTSQPQSEQEEVAVSPDTPPPLRGVNDKPFLQSAWRRAFLGGYMELEYHSFRNETLGVPRGFRAHRANLFAYADVTDSVRFGSEIEFENEEPGEDLEVKVEMAWADWTLFEELSLRGGALLVPLGRINVNHDGPVRDITERPLVSTFVIPSTLTEPGIGAHGQLGLSGPLSVTYEVYAVNGFRILDRDGELAAPITERAQLLREGRPSLGGDNNSAPAATGRVAFEIEKVLQAGGSWHVGTYDEKNDNTLSILAGDLALVQGPFALEGEIAWAGFERDAFARTAGIPDQFWGFYAQASASFIPEVLRRSLPRIFGNDGSRLTLVTRYDWVDLDGDRAQAIEPGVAFRPFADTVFKLSYRFGLVGLGVGSQTSGGMNDDGWVFSLSTYF